MIVAHLDTGRSWRGGQGQVLLLMRGLRARGHESVLIAPPGPLAERARAENLRWIPWSSHGEIDLAAVLAASRALREVRPAIAHCHSAHAHALGVPAALLAGVPGVVVSRRVDFAVGTNPLSRLKYRMPVDRYLSISAGVESVLRHAGIPASRLARVPSGIEFPTVPESGEDLRALLGISPDSPVIGTVAALAPHKNHADLMRAAAIVVREVPAAHFAWLGDGECRPALEAQRRALGLERHVHLLGFRADARALMRQFTIFALSSYLEGLCTSLLDAQVRGVPVVATAVGGVPEVVEDGVNGRLVPARDPGALAAALLDALRDGAARDRWAARARQTVEAFRDSAMVDSTLDQYRAVLAEHEAKRAMV